MTITEQIYAALRGHYPTRGMQVASGATCECRYWTGVEEPGVNRPAYGTGDQLDWHRAQLIAELFESEPVTE